jgi:hypothetical protein
VDTNVTHLLPRFSSRAIFVGAALLVWQSPGATTVPNATDVAISTTVPDATDVPSATTVPGTTSARASYASNPPLGHTGGFGEPTCRACHLDSALNHPDATLAVEGLPDRYVSGAVYRITVSVTGSGQGRNGFQASIRFADGPPRGLQAGHLSPTDRRVVVGADTLTAIQYAVHSEIGAEPVSAERGEWVVEWTAPLSEGSVILHVAGNSANGDNSPFGDLIHTLERTSEGPTR